MYNIECSNMTPNEVDKDLVYFQVFHCCTKCYQVEADKRYKDLVYFESVTESINYKFQTPKYYEYTKSILFQLDTFIKYYQVVVM
jgi:hypothetical protein